MHNTDSDKLAEDVMNSYIESSARVPRVYPWVNATRSEAEAVRPEAGQAKPVLRQSATGLPVGIYNSKGRNNISLLKSNLFLSCTGK